MNIISENIYFVWMRGRRGKNKINCGISTT